MVALGDRLADRYQLDDLLGRGATATVYRATDRALDRDVAIKVLTHPDPAALDELRREARLLAAIKHPNVVAVHDVIDSDEATFLVLELASGTDLATLLNRRGRLEPDEVVAIVADVAAALDAAHERGVLHRDVKPANIVVADDGRASVTDFGIGRFASDDTTGMHVRGSVAYVAPERLLGKGGDRRVDVYALAAVTMEALTGQPPFPASTPGEASRSHVQATPPSATSRRPELPSRVDEVLARGLAKRGEDRQPSAGAFSSELSAALRPRRRPLLAAVVGLAALAAVILTGLLVDRPPPLRAGSSVLPTVGSAPLVPGAGSSPDGEGTASPGPVPTDEAVADPAASSRPSDEATSSPSSTTSEPPPADVDEAAARFRADLEAGRTSGQVSLRAVQDLEQRLADVLDAVDRGQQRRIEQRLRDLRERLEHWSERNELALDLANQLDRRSRDLEQLAITAE